MIEKCYKGRGEGGPGGGGGAGRTRAEPKQLPHGGELPRAVGVWVSGRIVWVDRPDGEAQRCLPARPARKFHVRAAVSQQPGACTRPRFGSTLALSQGQGACVGVV